MSDMVGEEERKEQGKQIFWCQRFPVPRETSRGSGTFQGSLIVDGMLCPIAKVKWSAQALQARMQATVSLVVTKRLILASSSGSPKGVLGRWEDHEKRAHKKKLIGVHVDSITLGCATLTLPFCKMDNNTCTEVQGRTRFLRPPPHLIPAVTDHCFEPLYLYSITNPKVSEKKRGVYRCLCPNHVSYCMSSSTMEVNFPRTDRPHALCMTTLKLSIPDVQNAQDLIRGPFYRSPYTASPRKRLLPLVI
jgi:hypothetical protein